MSSLANAALALVIARSVSVTNYGAFAVAFSIYSLALAVSSAICGQVITIRYSSLTPEKQIEAVRDASGVVLAAGLIFSVVVTLIGLCLHGPLRVCLIATGIFLPVLVLQDLWRTVFISFGVPRQAFINDAVWTLLQVILIILLLLHASRNVVAFLVSWGVAATVAAALGVRQAKVRPSIRGARRWLAGHLEISLPSAASSLAGLGAAQVASILIAAYGSIEDVGAIRASQTLLGPLNIFGFAATAFAIPELTRRKLSSSQLVKAAFLLSGALVVLDAIWGTILLLIPKALGRGLLGDTWTNARSALPGYIVFTCVLASTVGASAVIRALNRSVYIFWISIVLGPSIMIFATVGAHKFGAAGASAGFAIAAAVSMVPAWWLFAIAVRRGKRGLHI